MNRVIYLDVDGVICHWTRQAMIYGGIDPDSPEAIEAELDGGFPAFEALFGGRDHLDAVVKDGGRKFWLEIPEFPWAKELVKAVKRFADNQNAALAFLTSAGQWAEVAASAKFEYLNLRWPEIPVIVCKQKYLVAANDKFLIDDFHENVNRFKHGGGSGLTWPTGIQFLQGNTDLHRVLTSLEDYLISWTSSVEDVQAA